MKTVNRKNRLISFCLILAMLLTFTAVTASAADTPAMEITSYSVSLDENINLNYYVKLTAVSAENVKMTFSDGTEMSGTEARTEGDELVFSYRGITPQYLDKKITATLVTLDSSITSVAVAKSVEDYCAQVAGEVSNDTLAARNAVAALLDYGNAARAYALAVDPDGANIGKNVTALGEVSYNEVGDIAVTYPATASGEAQDVGVTGAGLILGDNVSLYFNVVNPNAYVPVVKIGDETVSADVTEDRVTVTLTAAQLTEKVSLSFTGADKSVSCSVPAYLSAKKNVEENGLGLLCGMIWNYAVAVKDYAKVRYDGVVGTITFDDLTAGTSLANDQTLPDYNATLKTAITGSGQRLVITDEEDHTTGSGKSGKFLIDSGSRFPKFKIYNAFGHLLTEEDLGKTYRISAWVKTNVTDGITLNFGLLGPSAEDYCDTPPAGFETYSGYTENEANGFYKPTESATASIRANDTWQQVSIEITVTELMLSSHFGPLNRNGKVEYFNPALFSFKNPGYKECTIYLDDIQATYLGTHAHHVWDGGKVLSEATVETDGSVEYTCCECGEKKIETVKYDGVINRMNFDGFADGYTVPKSQTAPEYSETMQNATTGSGQNMTVKNTEDHTSGYGKSLSYPVVSGSLTPKIKINNCFGRLLTEEDIGKAYSISVWVKTDNAEGISMSVGLMCGSAWDNFSAPAGQSLPEGFVSWGDDNGLYKPAENASATVTATTEWKQVTISFVVTDVMLSTHFGAVARYRNGSTYYEYHNPAYLTFMLPGNNNKEGTLYFDDIETTYLGVHTEHAWGAGTIVKTATLDEDGEKSFTCPLCGETKTESYVFDGLVGQINFENIAKGEITNDQTRPDYNETLKTAITGSGQRLIVTDEEDHTTGSGKSGRLLLDDGSKYPIFKIYNAFGHLLTEADLGRTYRVSAWVKTDAIDGITLKFGLLGPSAWDTCDTPPEGFETYSGDHDFYKPTDAYTATLYATDEWQQVSIEVTVTELMLSSHFGPLARSGKVEYFNPALFSFKVAGYKPCYIYLDDIETTLVSTAQQ